MSPKLKKFLIIGGSIVGGIVLLAVIGIIAISVTGRSLLTGMDDSIDYGYGGGDAAMEEGYFAPAAEPMADYDTVGYEDEKAAYGEAYDSRNVATTAEQQIDRLIIRNGNVSMQVDDTRKTRDEIESIVRQYEQEGAFVVSSSEYGSYNENLPYINMSIRIPAERFDVVVEQLEAMAAKGTIPNISSYGQDVTEEYIDIQAQVERLEESRDRLLELMQNAETTEALLEAEQQLTMREAELNSLNARLKYLGESARLSRIDIDLQPYILSQPIDTRWRPAETLREAVDKLLRNLQNVADFVIIFAIAALPILAIIGLVIYGVVRLVMALVRRNKARKASSVNVHDQD